MKNQQRNAPPGKGLGVVGKEIKNGDREAVQDFEKTNSPEHVKKSEPRPGATPSEWKHLAKSQGLVGDLLPVVSDPDAKISPNSLMKDVGKTPSQFNHRDEVAGIAKWTESTSTMGQCVAWSKDDRLGICVQTRHLRAIDIDITDAAKAAEVTAYIQNYAEKEFGFTFPVRGRSDSPKCLLAVKVVCEEHLPKAVAKFDDGTGMVEFLGDGQQFVAFGTHPKGKRYEWDSEAPEFPKISLEQYLQLQEAIADQFGLEIKRSGDRRKKGESIEVPDDRYEYLAELDCVRDFEGFKILIECPFADGHSMNGGIAETTYFAAGSNGYKQGHYKCLHGSCAHRTDADFDDALGFTAHRNEMIAEEFEVIATSQGQAPMPWLGDWTPSGPMQPVYEGRWDFMAEKLMETLWTYQGERVLHRVDGRFLEWHGDRYVELDSEDLDRILRAWLVHCQFVQKGSDKSSEIHPTENNVKQLRGALISAAGSRGVVEGEWLDGAKPKSERTEPKELLACRDGLFDWRKDSWQSTSPRLLNTISFQHSIRDAGAEPPNWFKFLDSVFENDLDSRNLLQEFIGLILTGDQRHQKILALVGPPRCGKGVISSVIRAVVGPDQCGGLSPDGLGSEFGPSTLRDKAVNISADARANAVTKPSKLTANMLTISAGDTDGWNRKNRDVWHGRIPALLVWCSNEVPKMGDQSTAIASRFIYIRFTKSYLNKEDKGLANRLMPEAPQIMNWALEGARRVLDRGYLIEPEAASEFRNMATNYASPVAAWAKENLAIGNDQDKALLEDLHNDYLEYADEAGYRAKPKIDLCDTLLTLNPKAIKFRPRTPDRAGKRPFYIKAVRLKTPDDEFSDMA